MPTTTPYVVPVAEVASAGWGTTHAGYTATDIFIACGAQVVSPVNGRVIQVRTVDRWDPTTDDPATRGGCSVAVLGDEGVRYYVAHLDTIAVVEDPLGRCPSLPTGPPRRHPITVESLPEPPPWAQPGAIEDQRRGARGKRNLAHEGAGLVGGRQHRQQAADDEDRGGRKRGFGFVRFHTANDAQNAIDTLNGVEFMGRDLEVRLDNKA